MQLEKAVRIKKSFSLDSVKEIMGEDTLPTILLSGYASRGYTDSGHKAIDLDGETINQYGIDVSRLETKNIPLLFQHDQSKIVGKVLTASYDAKGLYVTAELTKLPGDSLTNYVYEAVKAKMLTSFSVGLMVEEIDWAEDNVIEITKSHLFELSIVSTPALASAVFSSTIIKSADGYMSKSIVDVNALKEDNPDMCDTLGCLLKATKKDKPVEDLVVKEVEPKVEPEVIPEVEPKVEPEVTPEVEPEVEPKVEPEVTPEVEPEVEPKVEPEATPEVVPEVVPEVTPEVEPEVKPEVKTMTLEEAISLLSAIKIEELSDDELEAVFETVSTLAEAVEKKVVAEVAEALLATT